MKRFLLAGALAFAAAGQGLAADLPEPAPPPQAPVAYNPNVVPVYNWGGIYYGINGGYAVGTSNWNDPNNPFGVTSTGNFSVSGFAVGPTVGANFQSDAFVFGVEGDFDYMGVKGTSTSTFCTANPCETKQTWLGTARLRVGYAADRVLFYGTAGGAFGNIEAGVNGGFQSSSKAGWTAGAGIEAALSDNWTARIEYLYVDLQNGTCNTANCGFDTAGVANDSVKLTESLIRLGVDYKFR
jgi:outer membrane immunogenic protein